LNFYVASVASHTYTFVVLSAFPTHYINALLVAMK